MNFDLLYNKFYAEYYDGVETQDDDIKMFIELIGSEPKNIFEICSGTGRILVPLAKLGHTLTGIDYNNFSTARLFQKCEHTKNITIKLGDVLTTPWGENYDYVLLSGNVLINIEGTKNPEEYKQAQTNIIQMAYDALKPGGTMIIDYDGFNKPCFHTLKETPRTNDFGTDSDGVKVIEKVFTDTFDSTTQVWQSDRELELTTADGKTLNKPTHLFKYIITTEEVREQVLKTGFKITEEYFDRQKIQPTKDIQKFTLVAVK